MRENERNRVVLLNFYCRISMVFSFVLVPVQEMLRFGWHTDASAEYVIALKWIDVSQFMVWVLPIRLAAPKNVRVLSFNRITVLHDIAECRDTCRSGAKCLRVCKFIVNTVSLRIVANISRCRRIGVPTPTVDWVALIAAQSS